MTGTWSVSHGKEQECLELCSVGCYIKDFSQFLSGVLERVHLAGRRDQSIDISLANVFVGGHVGDAREGKASFAGGRDIELIEIGHDGSQSLKDESHRQVGADLIAINEEEKRVGKNGILTLAYQSELKSEYSPWRIEA